MTPPSRRFDDHLSSINSDKLKPMMRLWGASTQLRKDECIAVIREGLADPAKVKAALATLSPFEANALALVKASGGAMDFQGLAIALRTTGIVPQDKRPSYRDDGSTLLEPLFRRGLLMTDHTYRPSFLSSYGRNPVVFADDRLLAQVGTPVIEPFKLTPIPWPAATLTRRPQTVALDLIGILQAVANLGGIQLTKDGRPRASEVRKLAKAMGWKDDTVSVDGFPFPSPSVAWIESLQLAGLLVEHEGALLPGVTISAFTTRPYADQIRPVVGGMVGAGDWGHGRPRDQSQRRAGAKQDHRGQRSFYRVRRHSNRMHKSGRYPVGDNLADQRHHGGRTCNGRHRHAGPDWPDARQLHRQAVHLQQRS